MRERTGFAERFILRGVSTVIGLWMIDASMRIGVWEGDGMGCGRIRKKEATLGLSFKEARKRHRGSYLGINDKRNKGKK